MVEWQTRQPMMFTDSYCRQKGQVISCAAWCPDVVAIYCRRCPPCRRPYKLKIMNYPFQQNEYINYSQGKAIHKENKLRDRQEQYLKDLLNIPENSHTATFTPRFGNEWEPEIPEQEIRKASLKKQQELILQISRWRQHLAVSKSVYQLYVLLRLLIYISLIY